MKTLWRNFLFFGVIALLFYFWAITLSIIFIVALIVGGLFYLIYNITEHVNKFKTFAMAKENKPKWFIFGNKAYIFILNSIERNSTKTKINVSELKKAKEFYSFLNDEKLYKDEIKHRWKEVQKIFHPDSGSSPNTKKSQLANKYKDILLNELK